MGVKNLSGKFHQCVIIQDRTRADRLSVVVLVLGTPLVSLANYFSERNKSLQWEIATARSVGLLIDFLFAFQSVFDEIERRARLLNEFAHRLKMGTLSGDRDDSDLWWLPRSKDNVSRIVGAVNGFSDHLIAKNGAKPLSGWRHSTVSEQIIFWRRWQKTVDGSRMAHLKDAEDQKDKAAWSRTFAEPFSSAVPAVKPKAAFPEEHFDELILQGFIRPGISKTRPIWERLNVRDAMIALLLNGGGVRVSEPFHLWVCDVIPDPQFPARAYVRIYHPTEGSIACNDRSTGAPHVVTRATYLQTHHGMRAISETEPGVGWKKNALHADGNYMPIFWFPSHYGELFFDLFKIYIEHCRPLSDSPYLFLTEEGLRMKPGAYRDLHNAAVRRIGLIPSKRRGTTPHGHRHAYGRRLERAKVAGLLSEKVVQSCFHHNSPESQQIYTESDVADVTNVLNSASEKINGEKQGKYLGIIGEALK